MHTHTDTVLEKENLVLPAVSTVSIVLVLVKLRTRTDTAETPLVSVVDAATLHTTYRLNKLVT
jgi:hypothetical protein